jgi:hypothetical protein
MPDFNSGGKNNFIIKVKPRLVVGTPWHNAGMGADDQLLGFSSQPQRWLAITALDCKKKVSNIFHVGSLHL